MYNYYSKNKNNIHKILLVIVSLIIYLLLYFASEIFTKENVYLYTFSTIAQGFIALVAFLAAVVVFKIQVEDQSIQKLSDGIEKSVVYFIGDEARTYNSIKMFVTCQSILEKQKKDHGASREFRYIEKIHKQMTDALASRNEVRTKMVNFALKSFLNIAISLISLLFVSILINYWYIGGILLSLNVFISIYILIDALDLVRRTLGYDFKI